LAANVDLELLQPMKYVNSNFVNGVTEAHIAVKKRNQK
jgi:hypothetical protein